MLQPPRSLRTALPTNCCSASCWTSSPGRPSGTTARREVTIVGSEWAAALWELRWWTLGRPPSTRKHRQTVGHCGGTRSTWRPSPRPARAPPPPPRPRRAPGARPGTFRGRRCRCRCPQWGASAPQTQNHHLLRRLQCASRRCAMQDCCRRRLTEVCTGGEASSERSRTRLRGEARTASPRCRPTSGGRGTPAPPTTVAI
mmetsp:Transcript_24126/g.60226  ORF Transcript_24126/g.60226 Transcript_24126/m.60226 type:complete len:200 (-) Transcript_24126:411-1010(-)